MWRSVSSRRGRGAKPIARAPCRTGSLSNVTLRWNALNSNSVSNFGAAVEVNVGELVVCRDPHTGSVTVQISDRVFNVFLGQKFENDGTLGSLSIKDDKMADRMRPGDQVLVDTQNREIPSDGGVFAVVLADGAIHCRRLTRLGDGSVRLSHLNARYTDLDVTLSESEVAAMPNAGRVKLRQGRL